MRVQQRRPLVGVALVFMSGILAAYLMGGMSFLALFSAVLCACLGWLVYLLRCRGSSVRSASSAATLFIFFAIFFLGYAMGQREDQAAQSRFIATLLRASESGEEIRIYGTVSSQPGMRDLKDSGRRMHTFEFSTRRVQTGREVCNVNGVIVRCNLFGFPGEGGPRYGERWDLTGRLRVFPPLSDDEIEILKGGVGSLHGRAFARLRSRFYFSGGVGAAELTGTTGWSGLAQRIYAARAAASELLSRGVEDFPLSVSITRALLLGYRSDVPSDIRSLFAETGTLHIFAISGLHVGIVAAMIVFVLSAARVSRTHWFFFLAPSLGIYIVLTGANPSALRAGVMALAYFAAYLLGRRADALSALALSALVIVVISPERMMLPGFIFSFTVVSGLLAIYPLFHEPIREITEPDPLRLEPERWWTRTTRVMCRYFLSLAGISISAWLVSAPLTAVFFERVSPVALLGNLFVAPLAFLIVVTASLSVVCGSIAGFAGSIFNHANVAFTSMLVGVTGAMRRLPLATLEVDRPPVAIVVGWYVLLAFAVAYLRGSGRARVALSTV